VLATVSRKNGYIRMRPISKFEQNGTASPSLLDTIWKHIMLCADFNSQFFTANSLFCPLIHCSSVSSAPSSKVPRWLLRASLWSFWLPTSPFGHGIVTRSSTPGTCGLSQSPVRRIGTRCLIRCVIQQLSQNVLAWDLKMHLFAVRH